MEFDSPYQAPKRPSTWLERHPFSGRIAVIFAIFGLLLPVSKLIGPKDKRVSTADMAGASLGAFSIIEDVPSTEPTPPSTALPLDTTTTPSSTPAPTPAPTTQPPAPTPTPAAAAVAPTTAKPVPTTAKPVATTAKPVATTAKPVATTAKPAPTTAKPAPTTAKPAPTTAKPAPTTAKPAPTTAKPAPTTAAVRRYSADEVIALIEQMWPPDSVDKALDVARKESGYRNWAYNGSCCHGVFQIHYGAHKRRLAARGLGLEGLYDPRVNIAIALEIYSEQGWSPWSTA